MISHSWNITAAWYEFKTSRARMRVHRSEGPSVTDKQVRNKLVASD
jgi:hypothetical protein